MRPECQEIGTAQTEMSSWPSSEQSSNSALASPADPYKTGHRTCFAAGPLVSKELLSECSCSSATPELLWLPLCRGHSWPRTLSLTPSLLFSRSCWGLQRFLLQSPRLRQEEQI